MFFTIGPYIEDFKRKSINKNPVSSLPESFNSTREKPCIRGPLRFSLTAAKTKTQAAGCNSVIGSAYRRVGILGLLSLGA